MISNGQVRFGAILWALTSVQWNQQYPDNGAMLDLCKVMNAELRELAAEYPLIQVEAPADDRA